MDEGGKTFQAVGVAHTKEEKPQSIRCLKEIPRWFCEKNQWEKYSFIYRYLLNAHDVLGTVLSNEDILVDKTKIPALMELICQKIINTYKMTVLKQLFLKSLEHDKGYMSVWLINQIILCICLKSVSAVEVKGWGSQSLVKEVGRTKGRHQEWVVMLHPL